MFESMLTLTYGQIYPNDGAAVKDHLNNFLSWLRREYDLPSYLWFLEFQARGAPHIHLLLSIKPTREDREKTAETWAFGVALKWRPFRTIGPKVLMGDMALKMYNVHKHPNQWQPIKTGDGAARYVTKYASKPNQKTIPPEFANVGRFWGASKDVRPKAIITDVDMTEAELRAWLKEKGRNLDNFDVLPKYIWLFGE